MYVRQRGFTLIELLTVLAIVSALAALALPGFFVSARRARASAEVSWMFSDLRVRLEQYRQERGRYPPSLGEDMLHPAGAPGSTRRALYSLPAAWQAAKIRPSGSTEVYCGYTWVSGRAGDATNIGRVAAELEFVAPAADWFYVLAVCDLDGDPSTRSYYLSSSVDAGIKKLHDGA